jgi:hypothetical protein
VFFFSAVDEYLNWVPLEYEAFTNARREKRNKAIQEELCEEEKQMNLSKLQTKKKKRNLSKGIAQAVMKTGEFVAKNLILKFI